MDMEQLTVMFQQFGAERGFLIWALLFLWRENRRAHQALVQEKERFCREKEGLVLTLQAEIRASREQFDHFMHHASGFKKEQPDRS